MVNKRRLERGIAGLVVVALVLSMVPMVAMPALAATPTELFFSEYIEGSSYNKALEIYNGTGSMVDLSAYSIELYSNGADSPSQTTALSGTLADGDVFVIAHGSADPAILAVADATNSLVVNFNGDDAVVLRKGTDIVDVIGQIGVDPGYYWGSGDVTTQNHTLRRKGTIVAGDIDGSDAFEPAVEWDGYDEDTFDGLGSHSISGGPDYTPIYDIQYTEDPSGDSPYLGQEVTTEGIVTGVLSTGYWIEDPAGGAWSGLWVYDSNGPILGDRLRVTGVVDEYYNFTELKDLTSYEVLSSGNLLPQPEVVSTGAVSDEPYESVLVRVENVTVTNADLGYGEWSVSDGSGDVVIDDKGSYTYVPTVGDSLAAVIGLLEYSYGAFKMQPRDDNDIVFPPSSIPIYDIQYTEDPGGDSPYLGQEVTTEGIVTGVLSTGYWIEDPAGGAWSGLWVYDSSGPNLGDLVRVTGVVDEYYNFTELKDLTGYEVLSSGNPLPAPVVVSTGAVSDEPYESVLVRVENVTVTNEDLGYGEWSVSDGSGDVIIDDKGSYTYVPTVGDSLAAVIGLLEYSYGAFKMQPRDDNDIVFSLDYTPIYDIQYTADPSGDSPYLDQEVTTEGIVTAVLYNGYWIEDSAGGPWSGLWVFDEANEPVLGDLVRLTGEVDEYYNLTELKNLSGYAVISSGNPLPEPVVVSTGAASDEPYEGVLVRVENVTVTNEDLGYGEWLVSDGSGDVVIDDKGSYTYAPALGDSLAYVMGPLDYAYGAFKIQPRDDDDIALITPPPALVINEFLADPASDLTGDANGDGIRDSGQDEFVEIVNDSDFDADISGWTLADGYSVRHTFPAGTVVPANCSIVVFGGGVPTGVFGGVVQTASSGALGLNNSGDTITLNDGSTDQAVVAYGSEGGQDQSLTRDPDVTGSFVLHSTATGSGGALFSPGTLIDGSFFAGCPVPEQCDDGYTHIYTIQGNGSVSGLDGDEVTTEGIVVGDFQDGKSGYYIQDAAGDGAPETSDGIFVYGTSPDVNVGDHVRVRGTVDEYYNLTEITGVSRVWFCGTGSVAPTPVSLPVTYESDFEQYEGMLVTFPQTLYISEYYAFGQYGEIVLTTDRQFQPTAVYEPGSVEADALLDLNLRSLIKLDDGRSSQNPDPAMHPNGDVFDLDNLFRGGDTVENVTGVVDYNFGEYKLQPTQGADYTSANPRTEMLDVGGNLKVASFNVLNYFTTLDEGVDICGPSGDMECRGADTAEEFERQRTKIIAALQSIDADIVGLIEIENHPENVPVADLVDGLNEAIGATAYAYVATGAIGTDAIRQAFIYKPATVSLVGEYAVLDSSVDPRFIDTRNRPVLAQTFIDNATGGIFTVAVNHLKSKGSSCADIGDPDLGDGAGNCNLTRLAAAEALVDWLADDPTGSGDSDFLIIGDLNSYDKEDPIDALLAEGYTDLAHSLLGEYAYSYVFDGQLGYLDYALASTNLLGEVTGATIWHINADEPSLIDYDMSYKKDAQDLLYEPNAFRASDHDPVIAGLDVCDEIAPTAEVTLNRDTLWPPRHQYVTVHAQVEASDNFDDDPLVELLSVISSQPDDGLGDGDTPDDIVIVTDYVFKLRAERAGGDEDRIYTITYRVTDDCGNIAYATATVTVPHDMR